MRGLAILSALPIMLALLANGLVISGSVNLSEQPLVYCMDFVFLSNFGVDSGDYSWVYAYVEGYGCIPSNGNLYDVYHEGGGSLKRMGIIYVYPGYEERGCRGDIAYTVTVALIYVDGYWYVDSSAYAEITAGPCGAI